MTLTFTKDKEGVMGDLRYWKGSITLDSSYVTGGYAITAANFLFGSTIYFLSLSEGNGGIVAQWDQTNSKIKIWAPTGGTAPTSLAAPSTASTATLSTTMTWGTGAVAVLSSSSTPSPTFTTTGTLTSTGTGGIAVEMASTSNLTTVILQAFAVGQ